MNKCEGCGREYEVVLMVPTRIWDEIKPNRERPQGGHLCGACILNRMEDLHEYRACGLQILVIKDGLFEDDDHWLTDEEYQMAVNEEDE